MDYALQVREILATRGLTLYGVSRRSAELFGRSSHFYVPHNLYYDLTRTLSVPTVWQMLALSHITDYRLSDWLAVFGFELDAIFRLQLLIPRQQTTILDFLTYDTHAWIPWFAERPHIGPVPSVAPLGQLLAVAPPRRAIDLFAQRKKAFAPDGKGFYYVHETLDAERPFYRAAYYHQLGSPFTQDKEIFFAGEDANLRLSLLSDARYIGFLVYRFLDRRRMDFFLKRFVADGPPEPVVTDARYGFGPVLAEGKILAITDREATNQRIVELRLREGEEPQWIDVVPESDARIQQWAVAKDCIFVSYLRGTAFEVRVFDFAGHRLGAIPTRKDETIRLTGVSSKRDELFFETESFTEPMRIFRYSPATGVRSVWAERRIPSNAEEFEHTQVWFRSNDGTRIPMYLAGRRDVLAGGAHPAILTSYGGYGVPMTAQFSVFVAFLMERGCLFALPNIRGGSEFGAAWHEAARRRNRQTAYDDFLSAAEWLVASGKTTSQKLAIFGGSNSGLLVGAAMTQRPDLFRAVVCMVPMLDMLRYHLFDGAQVWREEFGTADDPEDFQALAGYSPYHNVREGTKYPAVMIVSGDADRNCNPLHARKMTARLQAANRSEHPILLDYSSHRGHSPVLPLSERIHALTDRMAFLSDQLGLSVNP
jgi:prolyl oligopeptidase